MDALQLARTIAGPMGDLGQAFYFDAITVARGKELGLHRFEFYGLGRAGVLGDVETDAVIDAFGFFHPSAIDFIYTRARTKAAPSAVATDYAEAADDFADRTFGAVPIAILADFAEAVAAHVVARAQEIWEALGDGAGAAVAGGSGGSAPSGEGDAQ